MQHGARDKQKEARIESWRFREKMGKKKTLFLFISCYYDTGFNKVGQFFGSSAPNSLEKVGHVLVIT